MTKNVKFLLAAISLIVPTLIPSLLRADTPIITASTTISVTPEINTVQYTSGDLLGGKQEIANAARSGIYSGVVHSVLISDLAAQGADIDIVIFSANPTATTFTNNSALDIADADLPKIVCVIQVTNDSAFADNGVSFAAGNNCVFSLSNSTSLYSAPVVRGSPTYVSASDLTFRYSILQD